MREEEMKRRREWVPRRERARDEGDGGEAEEEEVGEEEEEFVFWYFWRRLVGLSWRVVMVVRLKFVYCYWVTPKEQKARRWHLYILFIHYTL